MASEPALSSPVEALLESDHNELDRFLGCVYAAIESGDCAEVYRTLDYFWARLAMHIRAEHLRLFPAVLKLTEQASKARSRRLADLPSIIADLHADHDFFMRELARAIKAMRLVFHFGNEPETLAVVRGIIGQVGVRLVPHNRIEEEQIYPLAAAPFLAEDELRELSLAVKKELENLPHRFRGSEPPA